MIYVDENSLKKDILTEKDRLRNQLLICLRFHHHELLKQVPLESAVKGMHEAWKACHPETDNPQSTGIPTEINPKIHNCKAFSSRLN